MHKRVKALLVQTQVRVKVGTIAIGRDRYDLLKKIKKSFPKASVRKLVEVAIDETYGDGKA